MTLVNRLTEIRATLEKSRINSPLAAPETCLLAASKGQPAELLEEAIALGIRDFGENRVQEAYDKWPLLKEKYPHIRLHLIGPLQTNKVKDALGLFDVIQTVDREKLALALSRLQASGFSLQEKQFYIQVNTGEEPQKAGIFPKEADDFIRFCIHDLKLPIIGLMCIPPADQPPAPHFALLRNVALTHGLKELSMGMSGDYDIAARMGSSCVRVGTALFGSR
ncbi:MAG: YggS family pyridoxal phosphate-dependent enzyme [Alphaproteobacteria bacterium]|nr:YggS family pyridoxal phosphate-dependent enzyme [Alphaproteobacteria bacterium]